MKWLLSLVLVCALCVVSLVSCNEGCIGLCGQGEPSCEDMRDGAACECNVLCTRKPVDDPDWANSLRVCSACACEYGRCEPTCDFCPP
jgi:hypothetical protein